MSQSQLLELITEISRQRYRLAEQSFATLGLTHTEARLLTLLVKADGEASQEALSAQLVIDRSNVGRALKSLENRGYIIRAASQADKRAKVMRITEQGLSLAQQLRIIGTEIEQQLLRDISTYEAELAQRVLQKIRI